MNTDDQEYDWWLLSNCYGGVHRAPGRTAADARRYVHELIKETYLSEGKTAAEATREAMACDVRLVAGPASRQEVVNAYQHAENDDWEPAAALACRTGRPEIARALRAGHESRAARR